jgi:hypothetical protein
MVMNVKKILRDLANKLTATQADKINPSIAEDVAGVVTDLNKVIKALKDSGIMKS